MPNCFQLSRKTSEKFTPESLARIDDEMCKHFGVTPHPVAYYHGWHDDIGFSLAMGLTFEQIIERIKKAVESLKDADEYLRTFEARRLEIAEWLNANFTSDAFATR